MTDYTPSTENILNCYAYSSEGYDGSLAIPERQSKAEFGRWLAEVERAAAAKALTDAADDWESGTVEHDEIKHTSDAPLGWGDGSVVDAVMSSGPVMTWLRKRAATYRREETE